MVAYNKDNEEGMIPGRRQVLGYTLATLLAAGGCAGPLRMSDLPDSLRNGNPNSPSVDLSGLMNSAPVPDTPILIYDPNVGNGMLNSADQGTLYGVALAHADMTALGHHNALPHVTFEYLQQITNRDLTQVMPGYRQEVSSSAKRAFSRVRSSLSNGNIEGRIASLKSNLKPQSGDNQDTLARKEYLNNLLSDFEQKAESLAGSIRTLGSLGRNFNDYNADQIALYSTLQRASRGLPPKELGERALSHYNINLPDLAAIASKGTDYDLRIATHETRRELSGLFDSEKIPPESYDDGKFFINFKEGEASLQLPPRQSFRFTDFLPFGSLMDIKQTGGYEGLEAKTAGELITLAKALEEGRTDDQINWLAADNQTRILINSVVSAAGIAGIIVGVINGGGAGAGPLSSGGGAAGAAGRGAAAFGPGF